MSKNLYYVIGASGAGKDTLLHALAQRVPAHLLDSYFFVRRYITRNQEQFCAKSNDISISHAEFAKKSEEGFFALSWNRYNTYYGISKSINNDLAQGKRLFINGSRDYLPKAKEIYPEMQIVLVEASAEILRQRLHKRGREEGKDLENRLKSANLCIDYPCIRLENSGSIEEFISSAIQKMLLPF